MKYRLVIFDSDGTLADTLPWMRGIFNELAEKHGFRKVEASEQEQFRDLHGLELFKALRMPLWKLPRVVSDMRKRMSQYTGQLSMFEGMGNVLEQLSGAGLRLAVVSSNSRANVERILGVKYAGLIGHYECNASMFGKAPKIRAVLRAHTVQPNEAIYIGDEIRDAEAAERAGVPFGAVLWGQHSAEALRARTPVELFATVQEIADRLVSVPAADRIYHRDTKVTETNRRDIPA